MKNDETIGQQFGRLGGIATRDKYGKDHFRELAKKSAEVKKRKKIEAKLVKTTP